MNGIEKPHLSPEVIEDAVLGRLSPEQRANVNAHLAQCPECREAIEQERLIAAGTRAWARAALKQKLAERVASSGRRRVPWPHVLGAAALVVVIIGVGVLFRWREPVTEDNLVFSDSVGTPQEPSQGPRSSAPPLQTDAVRLRQKEEAANVRDLAISDVRKKDVTQPERSLPAAPSLQTEEKMEMEHPPLEPSIAEATERAAGAAPAKKTENRGVVVTGMEVPDAAAGYSQTQPTGASQQGISLQRLEARKGRENSVSGQPVTFVIGQRLFDESTTDRFADRTATPTQVARSGDTLYVTLLVDSLLSPAQLRTAFGRQISPDSFQVILPDRVLGYRMPKSLTR